MSKSLGPRQLLKSRPFWLKLCGVARCSRTNLISKKSASSSELQSTKVLCKLQSENLGLDIRKRRLYRFRRPSSPIRGRSQRRIDCQDLASLVAGTLPRGLLKSFVSLHRHQMFWLVILQSTFVLYSSELRAVFFEIRSVLS